ncbi:MAG: hypothetical protein WBP16_14735 [Ferruginibacter sp.]
MKYLSVTVLFLLLTQAVFSQQPVIDKIAFFEDSSILNVVIETDISKLISKKLKDDQVFPGKFIINYPDAGKMEVDIDLAARGNFRRKTCYVPPLKLTFDKDTTAATAALKSLKLVTSCNTYGDYDQYVLKEFLVYKIYNLLTAKSLRVRLFNVEYRDNVGKNKAMQSNAFLIEDIKDAAKRNNCRLWQTTKIPQETTDRKHMTLVALFQYMIGNTDWSVSTGHNVKLIITRSDEIIRPYTIAYDFDFSGLVNTDYSNPDPILKIQSVRERLYRGFTRTADEVNEVLQIFTQQQHNIYSLINNFDLLSARNKKNMIDYLDEFYSLIKNPKKLNSEFCTNARR